MLVRIFELNVLNENDPYQDAKFLAASNFENIDKIIEFIKSLKGKDISIGDDWYTIEDYVWRFPKAEEDLSCLDVFVYGY